MAGLKKQPGITNPCAHPCEGCAYTEGSFANNEPNTKLEAQLALLGGLPFYCSHAIDSENLDYAMPREELRASGLVICRGWQREVRLLQERGYYDSRQMIRRAFAQYGIRALHRFLELDEGEEKREAGEVIEDVCETLGTARNELDEKGNSDG